ncbi:MULTISPECIES: metalloregulator ArsR/SmtB family transcription factor [unclassified Paenibacillus]|uniref:ArsR/SmtB family transcription factor n=1 Tax=unclassified Paenibacillus TaxID=185978 RepID=UPI0009570737|nr:MULTISPECIES: metalloregulator ArsR/SmtB family transcription factor [unclassified Paenibacillus]ASS65322.1 helix-turn-helix transcriptional regulator [Paenibacillus sp. RUD330]SIQ39972.1 DNA-binding transcriptional regulator, ArsR family [Paenibacillus sp. RU4X]SIQ62147.1 DNA-binding transcriptional regulator, ArsR family [Paenibacillus sp. RU4T]
MTDEPSYSSAERPDSGEGRLETAEVVDEDFGEESTANLDAVRASMLDENSAGQLADWMKAFSDPTRVRLVGALLHAELCVHDLTVLLDMNQSAVSHQLRYLRNMRIVKRRKAGKTVFYSLDDDHVEQIFTQTLQHIRHS